MQVFHARKHLDDMLHQGLCGKAHGLDFVRIPVRFIADIYYHPLEIVAGHRIVAVDSHTPRDRDLAFISNVGDQHVGTVDWMLRGWFDGERTRKR